MNVTVRSDQLVRALLDVVEFTGGDDSLPMLTGVHISVDNDRVTCSATDRYALAQSRFPALLRDDWAGTFDSAPSNPIPCVNGSTLIHARDVKRIIANYRPARDVSRSMMPQLTLSVTGEGADGALTVAPRPDSPLWPDLAHVTMRLRVIDAKFPELAKITPPETVGTEWLSINPRYLDKARKLQTRKNAPMVMLFAGSLKIARFIPQRDEDEPQARVLVMPVRHAGDDIAKIDWALG